MSYIIHNHKHGRQWRACIREAFLYVTLENYSVFREGEGHALELNDLLIDDQGYA